MQNNLKKVIMLMASMGVVSSVLAAPVVSQFNDYRPDSELASAQPETQEQRIKRFIDNSTELQYQLQQQVNTQTQEIARLNGIIDEQNFKIDELTERQHQLLLDVAELKESGSAMNDSSQQSVNTSNSVASNSSAEKTSYNDAVSLMQGNNNAEAIVAFETFLTNYPNSHYVPTVNYLLGQMYYVDGKDPHALKNFSETIKYKDSDKRPDALFKLGEIAKRNNNSAQATKFYNLVIADYPNSPSAQSAQQALSSL